MMRLRASRLAAVMAEVTGIGAEEIFQNLENISFDLTSDRQHDRGSVGAVDVVDGDGVLPGVSLLHPTHRQPGHVAVVAGGGHQVHPVPKII